MSLSQGKYPTANSVVNTGDAAWTGLTNLYANDNNYASVTLNAGQTSDTIRVSGFGFDAMADTDEIVSIYIYIYCYTSVGTAITLYEEIYGPTSGGSSTGNNDPVTQTTEATEYAGSSAGDTFGLALTAAEVKNSAFGVDLYVTNGSGGVTETFYIDTVYVTAYYGKSPAIKNIQTTTPSAGTSHVMAMPSGASAPARNECLVLLVAANLASDTTNELISISSGGAGWLKMFEHGSASTGCRIAGFIKNQYNDLGEGDVTISTSASCTTIGHYMTVTDVCSYFFLDGVCNPVKKNVGSETNIVVNGKSFNSSNDFKTTIAFAAFEGNTSGCATSGTGYTEKVDTQVTGLSTVIAERSLFDNTTVIPDVTFTPTTNYDGIGISITLVGNYNHTNNTFIDSYPDWRDGFQSRSKITISQDMVSGTANLTNFPVMLQGENFPVNTFNTSDVFDTYDASGDDIIFTSDPEGNEIIPHCFLEVTKNSEPTAPIIGCFVRVPTLYHNQDTVIYVWYDSASVIIGNSLGEINSTILPSQCRLTWYDYEFVFNYYSYDQGMRYYSGAITGSLTTNQTDPWGLSKATYFAGTDDYIRVDPTGSGIDFGDGDWFLQCWANPDASPASEMMICVQNPSTAEGDIHNAGDIGGFALMISSDGKYGVCGDVSAAGVSNYTSNIKGPDVNPTAEVFECVVGKFSNGAANAVYVNGTKYQNAHTQTWFVSTQNDAFTLGANSYVSGPAFDYAGDLIMCRLRKGGMTDDWIATEYANQSDPSYITGGPHASSAIFEQEGFRFRNDDGTEATATWIDAQDTNISRSKNVNTRLRTIVTWEIGFGVGNRLRLEYRKVGDPDTEWRPIE